MRILLETDNAIVSYDESKRAMVVMWTDISGKEEFYLVYNNVLKGFKIFFASTLILDFKKQSKLGSRNLSYLVKQIFPMAAKCGLRKLVFINVDDSEQQEISVALHASHNPFSERIRIEKAGNFEEAFSKLAV